MKFKVLMHDGKMVDTNLLMIQIGYTDTPELFGHTETIDSLIEVNRKFQKAVEKDTYARSRLNFKIANLKQCSLMEVELFRSSQLNRILGKLESISEFLENEEE